jgi:hypothetical protein
MVTTVKRVRPSVYLVYPESPDPFSGPDPFLNAGHACPYVPEPARPPMYPGCGWSIPCKWDMLLLFPPLLLMLLLLLLLLVLYII